MLARAAPGVLAGVLLAGCAGWGAGAPKPAASPQDPWAQRLAVLTARQQFALRGRIAVQRDAEGGQAQMRWRQQGEHFELTLSAPLGQGSYQLAGNALEVGLTAPDGARYAAADLDSLMTTHLKWSLPVSGARYWILGLPVPGRAIGQLNLDAAGRMTDLAQDGWRISVLEYQHVAGMDLPKKLFLLGSTLRLRLVVSEWTEPPH